MLSNSPSAPGFSSRFTLFFRSFSARIRYRFYSSIGSLVDRLQYLLDSSMIVVGPLLVLLAWAILAYFFYSYFHHLAPHAKFDPWQYPYNLQTILGLYLVFSIYYNHIAAVFTAPGSPPSNPNNTIPIEISELLSRDGLVIPSLDSSIVCGKCEKTKYPRQHHCSSCGKCILRMDHVRLTNQNTQ